MLRMGHSVVRLCLVWHLVAAPAALGAPPPVEESATSATAGDWTPSPGPWRLTERALADAPGRPAWQVLVFERRLGSLSGGRGEVDVVISRVEVQRIAGRETTAVADLLPVGNREIAVLKPGSRRLDAVPARMGEDDLGRWPNLCRLSILDASGALDLDRDGRPEIALRHFCSCPATACGGVLLVELSGSEVEILEPASLVPGVPLGRSVIEQIKPGEDPRTPSLQVAPDYLEECRFLALLGVRGSSDCADCCRFPVLLRPVETGAYEVYYDSSLQSQWLERAKEDIGAVAAEVTDQPLRSIDEARIARAAAFFYLTGAGTETRRVVSDALGLRARDFRSQDLLRRLEKMFAPEGRAGP